MATDMANITIAWNRKSIMDYLLTSLHLNLIHPAGQDQCQVHLNFEYAIVNDDR